MGRERHFLNQKIPSKNLKRPTAFFYPLSLKIKRIKNIQTSSERTEREHTQVCFAKRETRSVVFEEMRAPLSLSLSLSGWWHATTTTTTGENENERERKNRKLCANIFCAFSRARKNFSESFFFSSSSSLSKRITRDAFEQQQQRHEQKRERKRERERETSFSLSRDRKNALLSALWCWRLRRRAQKNHFN